VNIQATAIGKKNIDTITGDAVKLVPIIVWCSATMYWYNSTKDANELINKLVAIKA
tara:strand:- start:41 stop:208 length:168 start_codon:yes stop_codon:yes gene_type:complete